MKALGYLYVVPVALTCVVMLAIAMLNNVFLCWTNKRRYPAGGNMKLLCDVFKAHAPDPAFRFTTIQINCNYEAALHVDKFNLGPSYIVGVGDFGPPEDPKLPAEFAGRLWVQGRGALDVRERFVLFDGNAPHSTIPFAGARYTLIFFTHASQYALPEGERAYCDALGFPMPHPKLCKPPHMRTAEERLMAGRDQGSKRERNSQLQRLISRPFSTRFG